MPLSLKTGLLVSFEGLEGSGKSTQIGILSQSLKSKGYDVVVTREPGGTSLAESLRQALLSHAHAGMSARTELLLLMAGRSDHIEKVILPALAKGQVVIVDRFIDASFAYQGFGRQMGGDFVRSLHQSLDLWLQPHRSFFLDISLESSCDRVCKRVTEKPDRIEVESLSFFERVREGYLQIAQSNPVRYRIVNAHLSPDELHSDILEIIEEDLREYSIS